MVSPLQNYMDKEFVPFIRTVPAALSAAITAGLAQGLSAFDAIQNGRTFIQAAIEDGLNLGQGHGPTNHWAYRRRHQEVLR